MKWPRASEKRGRIKTSFEQTCEFDLKYDKNDHFEISFKELEEFQRC